MRGSGGGGGGVMGGGSDIFILYIFLDTFFLLNMLNFNKIYILGFSERKKNWGY